mmetsp:Transcript_21213/g.65467  ORF Transcript_21213/g.65467 Transcript_21213/m.65467 type:complete len:252 (-) Transcript_21213:131-886(-)
MHAGVSICLPSQGEAAETFSLTRVGRALVDDVRDCVLHFTNDLPFTLRRLSAKQAIRSGRLGFSEFFGGTCDSETAFTCLEAISEAIRDEDTKTFHRAMAAFGTVRPSSQTTQLSRKIPSSATSAAAPARRGHRTALAATSSRTTPSPTSRPCFPTTASALSAAPSSIPFPRAWSPATSSSSGTCSTTGATTKPSKSSRTWGTSPGKARKSPSSSKSPTSAPKSRPGSRASGTSQHALPPPRRQREDARPV